MIAFISNIAVNAVILLFLIIMYSYIYKLESVGCACSVHPYRDIIKTFTVFALVVILAISVVSTEFIASQFGETAAIMFIVLKLAFYMVCIVYFYMVLTYTRFLVNEKCKCSDDLRREILTAGAIIEIIVLFIGLLLVIILPILFGSLSYIVQNYRTLEKEMSSSLMKPVRTLVSVPSRLSKKSIMKSISSAKKAVSRSASKR